VDKESIVKQVIDKLGLERNIKDVLKLVKKNPSAPKEALDKLNSLSNEGYGFDEFKEIFRAIEKSTYINPTNKNVWTQIYKDFGCNFPIDTSLFKVT
jgi:hypothetical protein